MSSHHGGDPIEDYLDQLHAGLRGSPRRGRRLLAEAEDHLRQGVADGLAAGLGEREAQEAAISSFGSVRAVVRAHQIRQHRLPGLAVLADLVMTGWKLGAIALIAVGASGAVAAVMNRLLGRAFTGRVAPGTRLPAAGCRYWESIWPHAHSCAQAYMLESSSDAVTLRGAAGLAGLLLLAGYVLARRVARRHGWWQGVLPEGFAPTVAVSLFGAAGLGLSWMALMRGAGPSPAGGIAGPGFYLSGALIALAMAAVFGWRLREVLLRHARG